jgi:hypothetical protein
MKPYHNKYSTDGNVSIGLQMWEKMEIPSQKYCKGSVSKPIDGGG